MTHCVHAPKSEDVALCKLKLPVGHIEPVAVSSQLYVSLYRCTVYSSTNAVHDHVPTNLIIVCLVYTVCPCIALFTA